MTKNLRQPTTAALPDAVTSVRTTLNGLLHAPQSSTDAVPMFPEHLTAPREALEKPQAAVMARASTG
jgi:hypothetical protein